MTTDWDKMQTQLARVQAQVRELQQAMGIQPRTLEQRAEDWNLRQAEIARIAAAPRRAWPTI